MPKFLQPSLSSGELSPGLRGRVDMARYATSLARSRNFITKPTGGGAKRPGTRFRGYVKFNDRITRLIPFVYSTSVKYLLEMGHNYIRFWVDGALVTNSTKTIAGISNTNPAVVTSVAHAFVDGDQVVINGLVGGMGRINSRTYTVNQLTANTYELVGLDATTFDAYVSGGTASRIVEVATPYTDTMVRAVHYTQSADVLYMVHGNQPPKELRRTSVNTFELVDYAFRRGPFRPFNSDEAAILTTSGVVGIVTVTTNVDAFTAGMVGSLIYAEEKELRGIKPWASGEKNVPLGALRRSDSKVYRVSAVPTPSGAGTPYYVSGGVRPIHDVGRAYDGPQDTKFDGVNDYVVGVEMEFLHNTFGILKITAFTDARTVTAEVVERIPDSIRGLLPSPAASWLLSGPGTVFPIPGATSDNRLDYQVTINGEPIQSNPNYPGGGGVGGGGGGNPRPGSPIVQIPQ